MTGSLDDWLKDKIYYYQGQVTAYGSDPTGGHCGFEELPSPQAEKYFVAISSQDNEGWKELVSDSSILMER